MSLGVHSSALLSNFDTYMTITFLTNVPCNTIDFISNKGNKLPRIKINKDRIANRYDNIGIIVLKPHIDKITFGFTPTQEFINSYNPAISEAEYKKYIKGSLFGEATYSTANGLIEGVSLVTNVPFMKQPYSNYNINIRYKPKGASDSVFIQIDPKEENSERPFMRFDMNPSRFNKKAMAEFREFIEETLGMPGGYVTYDDVIASAPVYRADVAVDILGARPSDLEIYVMVNKKLVTSKSHTYNSPSGRIQTLYPKVKKGKSSSEYLYDKRQELIDTNQPLIYGDFLHTRYECRIGKTTFHKLAKTTNRCGRISARALDIHRFAKMGHVQRYFIRIALDRTLDKAIEMTPHKLQAKYKKAYDDSLHNIWDAKNLWSYWKNTVSNSGFFPLNK